MATTDSFRAYALRVTRRRVAFALMPLLTVVLCLIAYVVVEITAGQQYHVITSLERTIAANVVDGDTFQLKSLVNSLVKSGIFSGVDVRAQRLSIARAGVEVTAPLFLPFNFTRNGVEISHVFVFDQMSGVTIAVSNRFSYLLIFIAVMCLLLSVAALALATTRIGTQLATELSTPLVDLAKAIASATNKGYAQSPSGGQFSEVRDVWQKHEEVVLRLKTFLENEAEAQKNAAIAATTENLSHDIKNPLITFDFAVRAQSWSEFLGLKAQMARSLNTIRSILSGLGQTSGLKLEVVDLDLSTTVRDLATIFGRDGTSIEYVGPPPFVANLDLIAVNRAIGNLVKNAHEAGAGKIVVEVSIEDRDIILKVADNGPGVPSAIVDRLFKRGASYGKGSGQGIGLHNVKNMADGHWGFVEHQRIDGWTVFKITLPKDVIQLTPGVQRVAATKDENVSLATTILVRLPDLARQDAIQNALLRQGFDAVTEERAGKSLALIYTDFDLASENMLEANVRLVFDDEDHSIDAASKKIANIFASIMPTAPEESL